MAKNLSNDCEILIIKALYVIIYTKWIKVAWWKIFKKIWKNFVHLLDKRILSGARKSSILAGSKEKCLIKIQWKNRGKLVGPIIHCSPDLIKAELCRNMKVFTLSKYWLKYILWFIIVGAIHELPEIRGIRECPLQPYLLQYN